MPLMSLLADKGRSYRKYPAFSFMTLKHRSTLLAMAVRQVYIYIYIYGDHGWVGGLIVLLSSNVGDAQYTYRASILVGQTISDVHTS